VPWDNATPTRPTIIYRRDPGSNNFVAIGTVQGGATGSSYIDRSTTLVRGQTYRYYVQTNGTYNNPRLPDMLLNRSQEIEVEYVAVPCKPVLTVNNNCESLSAVLTRPGVFPRPGETYTNNLSWQVGSNTPEGCDNSDIDHYDIFYRPDGGVDYQFLASTKNMTYAHEGLTSQLVCYTVQAVNKFNRRSLQSDSACADNCLLFLLPNIFTPNGDGVNDTFRPKVASPLRRIHFTAYNRWGVKVYESQSNPLIDWSGEEASAEGVKGGKVSEGVYYYQAEVEFADLQGTKKTYKGWVQINR
jgi:gliding motility-associated-like protein